MSKQEKINPADALKQVAIANSIFDAEFQARSETEITTILARLKEQLDRDHAWIRQFDSKVTPILAADGVLIGLAVKMLGDNYTALSGLAPTAAKVLAGGILASCMLLSVSVVYGILAISPRLSWREVFLWKYTPQALIHDDAPSTQLYFDHLAAYDDFGALTRDVITTHTQPGRYAAQLLQQVHANAAVARDKATQVRWCIKLLFLGILLASVTALGTLMLWKLL